MNAVLDVIHHEGHDPAMRSPYVPAIRPGRGGFVFLSGLTAAPPYHDHPHVPEVFEAIPPGAGEQMELLLANLDRTLASAGCGRADLVNLIRFFTDVERDQDVVNGLQAEWFGGHVPTSTSVEVARLATDPQLRIEIQAVAFRGEG
ncbi:RidA family protein [Amycolatopsis sp. NPDC051903]|uniref:RidA family protein n=1 Tax=Amycolatopsis sp. NPDC051903 TaxID=3363936 RepID=UPI00378A8677